MEHVEVTDPITTAAGTFRVCVDLDSEGFNPRNDDGKLGTMVCQVVRSYPHNTGPREGALVSTIDEAIERGGWRLAVRYLRFAGAVVLPLYGTDRISAGTLGETVDNGSSVSGVIYAMRSDFCAPTSDTDIAGWLAAEVSRYAAWATGEMFDYVIERLADDCECDDDTRACHDCACWSVVGSSGTYYSVEEALEVGRERVPTERELTDAQWLAELFEFELCGECGRDADQHTVRLDPVGLRHAWCTDPIPESWTDLAWTAELTRRMERGVEVTEPATAYAAIRITGTVHGYGPVRMRGTERTLSPSRIMAGWWQEDGELTSVAVYGNSTDQGLAAKVVYWTENLDEDAPQWVREFVTEHQPPTVRTWANGYGLWFARVPVSDNAASVAKAAIMSELRQRESHVCESRVSVELVTGNRDTVVYREVDPDDNEG